MAPTHKGALPSSAKVHGALALCQVLFGAGAVLLSLLGRIGSAACVALAPPAGDGGDFAAERAPWHGSESISTRLYTFACDGGWPLEEP